MGDVVVTAVHRERAAVLLIARSLPSYGMTFRERVAAVRAAAVQAEAAVETAASEQAT